MRQLRHHHVGNTVIYLGAEKDDALGEQPGVDVIRPLAERGPLHHGGNRVLAHDHSPARLAAAGRTSSSCSASISTSAAVPPKPAEPWCISTWVCGRLNRLPAAPAHSRNWPMLPARPIASVRTSLGIRRIVS